MPIPWLVGEGWGLFLDDPQSAIDLFGSQGRFTPSPNGLVLPIDVFVTAFESPAAALTEYARITGFPALPPIWALGYQQSHRTLESYDAMMTIAHKFRDQKLLCSVLIYLDTGFAPSGWNTGHRPFQFNPKVFPDRAADIRALHEMAFKVVLHERPNVRPYMLNRI